MYPPGYPIALALWSAIGGERIDWLVIVNLAASAAALLFFFSTAERRWGSSVALLCLAAIAANAALLSNAAWILSEAPFMLWTAVALWAASRDDEGHGSAFAASAAAIAAAATRSAGVTIVAALGVYWLWRRRYDRAALLALASSGTIGAWLLFSALAPSQVPGSSYVADAVARPPDASLPSALAARLSRNVLYPRDLYQLIAPNIERTQIDGAIGMAIVGAGLIAGLVIVWRHWPVAVVYLALYGTLLLVWPWVLERFLTPLLPWLIAAIVLGVGDLAARLRPDWRMPAIAFIVTVLTVTGLSRGVRSILERSACDRSNALPSLACLGPGLDRWGAYFGVVQHVRDRVEPGAIIVAPFSATLYLHTGHLAVPLPEALDRPPSEFLAFLKDRGVTYILLSGAAPFTGGKPRLTGATLPRMVKDNCGALRIEYEFPPAAYLFRVARVDELETSSDACHAADEFIARYGAGRR